MKSKFSSQTFLRISLIFVLVGSLRHVAWGFSTLEGNGVWPLAVGYFQALAVDLVVVALSYAIEQHKKSGLSKDKWYHADIVTWYWVGIVGFVLVSTYANLLYGLVFSIKVKQSTDWPELSLWMVYLKPFVLSGVLPIMLVYISHITAGSQASSVTVSRPELKTAWVRSIIDHWQQTRQRIPTPAELVRVYSQETGQALTVQEATGFLAPAPVIQAIQAPVSIEPLSETEQATEQVEQAEQGSLTDQEIDRQLVHFYKDQLGLSWKQVAEKMGKSKTTLIKYYQAEPVTNGRVK